MQETPGLVMPVLRTGGLVLRPFRTCDAALAVEASQDPYIPLITTVPVRASREQGRAWIERQHERLRSEVGYSFAIAQAGTDEALGQMGLWPDRADPGRASIGYWLLQRHRGRGIARCALAALVRWGLEQLSLARLELYVEPDNVASQRVAEGTGFHREGLMRDWATVGERRRDMFLYSLLPRDR